MAEENLPATLYVSGSHIEPCLESWDEINQDPRGILFLWEAPRPRAKYQMGCDPSYGITNWSRASRTEGDHKTDNAAIEVFRIDGEQELVWKMEKGKRVKDIDPVTGKQRIRFKDVQVAEFAAPVDPVEIAGVCDLIGRIFAGEDEDQCQLIHEAFPGPGILTTQELIRRGYANFWMWEYIDSVAEETNRIGWRSTRESQKLLWQRSRRHLMNKQTIIRSKWLLSELSNAEIDLERMRARASYGFKDDRMQACTMAWWGGHAWVYDVERTEEAVTEKPVIDFQRYAPTLGDKNESWDDWKAGALESWY